MLPRNHVAYGPVDESTTFISCFINRWHAINEALHARMAHWFVQNSKREECKPMRHAFEHSTPTRQCLTLPNDDFSLDFFANLRNYFEIRNTIFISA